MFLAMYCYDFAMKCYDLCYFCYGFAMILLCSATQAGLASLFQSTIRDPVASSDRVCETPCGLYGRQPLGVGIVFAFDDVEEGFLEQVRDGAAFSGSDLPVVDFPNRRHFGGCSREEHFLGHV